MFSDYIIAQARDEAQTTRRLADNNPDEVRDRLKHKADGLRGVVFEFFEEGNNNECYKATGFLQMITIIEALADDVRAYYLDYLAEATETRR